jgi:uncharacterized protein (DUF427 family)
MAVLPRENVQSYPRPPALEPVPQGIRVLLEGVLVAETSRLLRALETHHAPTYYLPREDIHAAPGSRHQLLRMEGHRALFRCHQRRQDSTARRLGL